MKSFNHGTSLYSQIGEIAEEDTDMNDIMLSGPLYQADFQAVA